MILDLPSDLCWHRKEEALSFLPILAVAINSGPLATKRNHSRAMTPLIYECTVPSNPGCSALINFLPMYHIYKIKYFF